MNQEKLRQYIYDRIQVADNNCWMPTKPKLSVRQGGIYLQGNRLAWVAFTGQIPPKDVEVYSKCENVCCVNPEHLGTRLRSQLLDAHTRFWQLVNVRSPDECWEWMGSRNQDQYGRFRASSKNVVQAHRFAYEEVHGLIPPGKMLCHSCDNPPCVNPSHLFVGDQSDNMKDMYKKKRHRIINDFKGERQPTSKLVTDDILHIRAMHRQGVSVPQIHTHYPQVSRANIQRIIWRKTWRHIE